MIKMYNQLIVMNLPYKRQKEKNILRNHEKNQGNSKWVKNSKEMPENILIRKFTPAVVFLRKGIYIRNQRRFDDLTRIKLYKEDFPMPEKDFADIDANYKSQTINDKILNFYDGFNSVAELEGFPYIDEEGRRSRVPLDIAKQCEREGVYNMSMQGAGELLRFRTDSDVIAVRAGFAEVYVGLNRGASAGFDLYSGKGGQLKFIGNRVIQPQQNQIEAMYSNLSDGDIKEYSLYFPLHCACCKIEIGINPDSKLLPPLPHALEKPVVFYGSSITNCGAVGRPGLGYPSIIARKLDFHLINMGLSGSCRGELCMAETIAKLDIAALVLEFDHNAPSPEFLEERHEPFFQHYRKYQPETPVLIMSKCDFDASDETKLRREIIINTWKNAVKQGDKNVYFLDGETLLEGDNREDCTQDRCHPNDYGSMLMAERISAKLRELISIPA